MFAFSSSFTPIIMPSKCMHLNRPSLFGKPSSTRPAGVGLAMIKCSSQSSSTQEYRTRVYHPPVWESNDFLSLSTTDDMEELWKGRIDELKKEVNSMLSLTANDPFQELDLVNTIQRLGLAYHFEGSIQQILDRMYKDGTHFIGDQDSADDLHFTSIWFRILRQAGYYASSDVFNKFRDDKGEFRPNLSSDVRAMLSLYEATFLSINGEDVMDEALAFTTKHLNCMLPHLSPPLALEVEYALRLPIQQCVERVQARQYISIYQQSQSPNQTLLELAKLDFNALQLLYRKELKELMRWNEETNIKQKLPYDSRDRIVECYVITNSIQFEPQFSLARIHQAKLWSALSEIDDAHDVYANLKELEPLSVAFQRWDYSEVNGLSEPMKAVFQYVLNIVDEIEHDILKRGHTLGIPYLKKEFQVFTNGQFEEATLAASVVPPSLEEWLPVSLSAGGISPFLVEAVMNLGDLATNEVFNWSASMPKILHCNYMIARIMDDIGAAEHVADRAVVTFYYMNEHGVSKQEAIKNLGSMLPGLWKDLNAEYIKSNDVPKRVLKIVIDLTRLMYQFYSEVDGYAVSSGRTKEIASDVLIDPIPI